MVRFYRNRWLFPAMVLTFSLLAPVLATAQITWVQNFDDALKQAAKEKKFIILDISASW
jgi:hypothetical protein